MKLEIVILLILSSCLLLSASKCNNGTTCNYRNVENSESLCTGRGCCWDEDFQKCFGNPQETIGDAVPHPNHMVTFHGTNNDKQNSEESLFSSGALSLEMMLAIMQMRKDGVDKKITTALIADSIPNGKLLYYLADDDLSLSELIELQGDFEGLDLGAIEALVIKGGTVKDVLMAQMAGEIGIHPVLLDLIIAKESKLVEEHLIETMDLPDDPVSSLIIKNLLSGTKTTTEHLKETFKDQLIDQLIGSNFDTYTSLAFKALLNKQTDQAKKFLLISQLSKKDFKPNYPQNEAIFAYMVDKLKEEPGKIKPDVVLAMALDEKIPALSPAGTFSELFGITAQDYVCAAHTDDLVTKCRALPVGGNTLDCFNVGCCLKVDPFDSSAAPICFENILGNIGIGLSQALINEDDLKANVFQGSLPDISDFYPDGIPWIISSQKPTIDLNPDGIPSWWDSIQVLGPAIHPNPKMRPISAYGEFNPGFEWQPHAVTPFPSSTQGPSIAMMATESPGVYASNNIESVAAAEAIVKALQVSTYSACYSVPNANKIPCMSNADALVKGKTDCELLGCCFIRNIKDLNTPMCFSTVEKGQCHAVADLDKIECGAPGITIDECLSDKRCCFNDKAAAGPHCYFKKYGFIPDDARCASATTKDKCFEDVKNIDINNLVSQDTCLRAGCCYQAPESHSFLAKALGMVTPGKCFKMPALELKTTDAPPATTTTAEQEEFCQLDESQLLPYDRVQCGPAGVSRFHCLFNYNCCWKFNIYLDGVPSCFAKSLRDKN